MLDQPNDDIEALSPMLPKGSTSYNTPYELQQVHLQVQNTSPVTVGFSVPPPLYQSPVSDANMGPSRRDSGTLPTPQSPSADTPETPRKKPKKKKSRTNSLRNNDSSYDIDGPEVRERVDYSYGYNPGASTASFPTPQPLPGGAISPSRINRVSTYDPSAEEGYDISQGRSYAQDGRQAENGTGRRAEGGGHDGAGARSYQLTDQGYQR